MYQFTFDQDTTNKLTENTKKSKTVLEQFDEIDNRFNTMSSDTQKLNLTKMQYTKPSDEEVKKRAENSLYEYKTSNVDSINKDFETKSNSIDSSIKEIEESGNKQKQNIKSAYEEIKQDAKDDAIKRGLARSSIIVNTLATHDGNMIKDLQDKTNEINSKIEGYQNEKSLLEQQKQNALSSFDISYAVKLQEKIDDINKTINNEEQEVIKYNNQIAELQAEWEKEQSKANFDKATELADLVGKYGSTIFEVLKQNEKLEVAKNHFNQMDKNDAINELKNNPIYFSNLGNKNYNKLLDELTNK